MMGTQPTAAPAINVQVAPPIQQPSVLFSHHTSNSSGSTYPSHSGLDYVNSATSSPQIRQWAVSNDEKQRYDAIFKSTDAGNLGYISGKT